MFRARRWWGCLLITTLVAAGTGRPTEAAEAAKKGAPQSTAGAPSAIAKATPRATSLPAVLPPLVAPPSSPGVGYAGLWLGLDPVSGDRVQPAPGQIQDLVRGLEAFRALGGEPIEVTLADGSRGVYLGRRFAKALMAHIGPQGKVVWGCGVTSATPVVAEE